MKLLITNDIWDKLFYFVDKTDFEISFFGRIKLVNEGKDYQLTKLYLVKQENSASETEMDEIDLGKVMYASREDEGFFNCWIHSHNDMAAHWSQTDVETTKKIGDKGFCLSLVVNKKRETRVAYYQGSDKFRPAVYADNLTLERVEVRRDGLTEEWDKEFDEKCSEWEYTYAGVSPMDKEDKKEFKKIGLAGQEVKTKHMKKKNILEAVEIPLLERHKWWRRYCKEYGVAPHNTTALEVFYWDEIMDEEEKEAVDDAIAHQMDRDSGSNELVGLSDKYFRDANGFIIGSY